MPIADSFNYGRPKLYHIAPGKHSRKVCLESDRIYFCGSLVRELDPEFAAAHSGLAYALFQEWMYSEPQDRSDQLDCGVDAARRSIAIDDHDANAHSKTA